MNEVLGSSRQAKAITPNDSTDIDPKPCRAVYIGGAGNISLIPEGGSEAVTFAVIAGQVLPVRAKRIMATNTTATGIVALY